MSEDRLDLRAFQLGARGWGTDVAVDTDLDRNDRPREFHDEIHLLILGPTVSGAHATDASGALNIEFRAIDLAADTMRQIEDHSLLCAPGNCG